MEFAVVWLFFAGLTGAVAAAKGRNPFAWGAAGVVFGIFALAYVAFAPREEKGRGTYEPDALDDVKPLSFRRY